MPGEDFLGFVKEAIREYVLTKHIPTVHPNLHEADFNVLADQLEIRTVWYCKTLQNHKGLFCTNLADQLYFEVTYNGDKNEVYLDVYEKKCNIPYSLTVEE